MEELIMLVTKKSIYLILFTLSLLTLSACSKAADNAAPAEPTMDVNGLKTQIAQTVIANITVEAAANPSSTPTVEITNTPLPSQTPFPTQTEINGIGDDAMATATKKPASSSGGWVVYPTKTKTPYVDSAKLISQSPKDGYTKNQDLSFPSKWTIQNTGKRKWNRQFYLKFTGGEVKPANDGVIYLTDSIDKGDSITMTIDLHTPNSSGKKQSNWALINDDGVAILHFYLVVNVP
jgi:hypothetical protein